MRIIAVILCMLSAPALTKADNGSAPILIGLHVSPPFVMEDQVDPKGFAVELVEKILVRIGRVPDYRFYPTVDALLSAASHGQIDLAVSNITAGSERASSVDFSYPWLADGLTIIYPTFPKLPAV